MVDDAARSLSLTNNIAWSRRRPLRTMQQSVQKNERKNVINLLAVRMRHIDPGQFRKPNTARQEDPVARITVNVESFWVHCTRPWIGPAAKRIDSSQGAGGRSARYNANGWRPEPAQSVASVLLLTEATITEVLEPEAKGYPESAAGI